MKRVFLIDDDPDDREIFQLALQSLKTPAHYMEAKDGQHALEMMDKAGFEHPDLMFIDLNMPRVNGLELLLETRKRAAFKHTPIYIYSTSAEGLEKTKCLRAGATGFIVKHNSLDALCEELERILANERSLNG